MDWRRSALRAYRALLFAYPAEFRHEYGEEMERLFAMRLASEPHLLLWFETLSDAVLTAPREHLHILATDLRHSARALMKMPGFVLAALLAVALGVCATTVVFSVVHAVLIRSLPYGNPERLVYMWTPAPGFAGIGREKSPFYPDIVAWQTMSRSLTNITAMQRFLALMDDGSPQPVVGARVLGNFFRTLDATPQRGRPIDANDDRPGAEPVAVISDGLWHSRFGGDSSAIGATIRFDRHSYRVIGVMPREFSYPHGNDFPGQPQFGSFPRTDVWIPAALTPKQQADPGFDGMDAAIGRLRAGATAAQAQAEISAIEKRLNPLHPEGWTDLQALLVPFLETSIGPVRPLLRLLTGAVCLVLLMACGNLASLLMARAANRVHEMGVRTALGADRSRLMRLMLTESLILSVVGGVLAVGLSYSVLQTVIRLNPGDIPRLEETTLNTPVLLFGLFVAIATGLCSGILPAISASRVSVCQMLRHGRGLAGASLRVRNLLVVLQIAVAVVLLAGAGLLIRSYLAVQNVDRGFAPSALTMSVNVDQGLPNHDSLRREAMERIQTAPGVQVAGSIDDLPLSTYEDKGFLEVDGYAGPLKEFAEVRGTAGEYFQAMQIPILEGRYLNDGDIPVKPETWGPAVVSESLARRYLQGRPAVGHRLRINGSNWSTIVGVVGDVRHVSLEQAPEPTVYYQNGNADSVAMRVAGAPDAIVPAIRRALSALNVRITVTDVETMDRYVDQSMARRRFQTVALGSFAVVAVFLALVGFYGLLTYAVTQRTAEVGLRMALGASRSAVVGLVVRYGLTLTSAGLAIGLVLAGLLTRTVASFLYGVRPLDLVTFVAVPAVTLVVAAIAGLAPAWKAASVDPVDALRR